MKAASLLYCLALCAPPVFAGAGEATGVVVLQEDRSGPHAGAINAPPLWHLLLAEKARAAGRYDDSLQELMWIDGHATEYPELHHILLPGVLRDWMSLARQYPPALDALKQVRKATARRIRDGDKREASRDDLADIDQALAATAKP